MTKFSEKKEAQEGLPALGRRIKRVEQLIAALVTDMEFIKQRLAKVEVVKAGPKDHDVAGTTFETQLDEPQRPETE